MECSWWPTCQLQKRLRKCANRSFPEVFKPSTEWRSGTRADWDSSALQSALQTNLFTTWGAEITHLSTTPLRTLRVPNCLRMAMVFLVRCCFPNWSSDHRRWSLQDVAQSIDPTKRDRSNGTGVDVKFRPFMVKFDSPQQSKLCVVKAAVYTHLS